MVWAVCTFSLPRANPGQRKEDRGCWLHRGPRRDVPKDVAEAVKVSMEEKTSSIRLK